MISIVTGKSIAKTLHSLEIAIQIEMHDLTKDVIKESFYGIINKQENIAKICIF